MPLIAVAVSLLLGQEGCRPGEVDRTGRTVLCAGHEVYSADLLAMLLADEPADASVTASRQNGDWLDELKLLADVDFRSSPLQIGGRPAQSMSYLDERKQRLTLVMTMSPSRVYLCRGAGAEQVVVRRCNETISSLLEGETPAGIETVCGVTKEGEASITRHCGALVITDATGKATVAEVRSGIEKQFQAEVAKKCPRCGKLTTTPISNDHTGWTGWFGAPPIKNLSYLAIQAREDGAVRFVMCGAVKDAMPAMEQRRFCPLLAARILAEPRPR